MSSSLIGNDVAKNVTESVKGRPGVKSPDGPVSRKKGKADARPPDGCKLPRSFPP